MTVRLGLVPTDLLVGAKTHVDNLVRELTLALAGEATGQTALLPARLAALDELDTYARTARLLTLATSPAEKAFRRWYVESPTDQLAVHARGERPAPPGTLAEWIANHPVESHDRCP